MKWILAFMLFSHVVMAEQITWQRSMPITPFSTMVYGAANRMASACRVRLNNVAAGEAVDIAGDVTVTNNTEFNVGFTTEIIVCDPKCHNLRKSPNFSDYPGGNVDHQWHHETFQPFAHTAWRTAHKAVNVFVVVYAYSDAGAGRYVSVDRCGLFVTRHKP